MVGDKLALFLLISIGIITIIEAEWKMIDKPCLCQEFRCDNGTSCLHKTRVCNKYKDCPGNEDESFCSERRNKNTTCSRTTEFKCKFGGCIPLTAVCDGTVDCAGGVDEASDFCAWVYGNNTDFVHTE